MKKKYRLFTLLVLVLMLISCTSQDKGNAYDETIIRVEGDVYYSQFARFDISRLQDFDASRTAESEIKAFILDIDKAIINVSEYLDCPNWQEHYLGKNGIEDDLYIDIRLTNGITRIHNPPLAILCNSSLYNKNRLPMTRQVTQIICPNQTSKSLREGLAQFMQAEFAPQNLLFVEDMPIHEVASSYFETMNEDEYDFILASIGKACEIDKSAWAVKKNRAIFSNLSYSFVKYLIDEYGMSKFMSLYNAENLDAAYQEVYNKDYALLLEEWISFIDR